MDDSDKLLEFSRDKRYDEKVSKQKGANDIFDVKTILSLTGSKDYVSFDEVLNLFEVLTKKISSNSKYKEVERPLYLARDYILSYFPEFNEIEENNVYDFFIDEDNYFEDVYNKYGKYYPISSISNEYLNEYCSKCKTKKI